MANDIIPYEQGYLDGLCGVYSIINATRLLVNISEEECMKLFRRCLTHVEEKKRLSKAATEGITKRDVWNILKNVVMASYPIASQNPFLGVNDINVEGFFTAIQTFLKADGKRAVIVGFYGPDWDHWTVIKYATAKRLTLFDSSMMKIINISRCAVKNKPKKMPFRFDLKDTFFLLDK